MSDFGSVQARGSGFGRRLEFGGGAAGCDDGASCGCSWDVQEGFVGLAAEGIEAGHGWMVLDD